MVDSPHHPEQEVIFGLGVAGVIDPDSETKKKPTKTVKLSKVESVEPEVKVEPKVKVEPEVKVEPKVKVELEADSTEAEAKIEDIPEDSE